ncbi:hypothetical protein GCM10010420_48950 [Streptomyces glaucosporus]|uniref:Uncharacterized protein n=1 Tax=Streptomyces glaucosporus TaxID=284044 RepID=A0ABN3IVC5_9ACTN
MSFHAEYALAQYRAAQHGRDPLPLPGEAGRHVPHEFRDALLEARTRSRSGPRPPRRLLPRFPLWGRPRPRADRKPC